MTLFLIGHDEEELVAAHPELRTVLQGDLFDAVFFNERAVGATEIFQAGVRTVDSR